MTPLHFFNIEELKEMLAAVQLLDVSNNLERQETKQKTITKIGIELFQRARGKEFENGYAVMKYLLENPCQEPNCENQINCSECINYAIDEVAYEAETKRRANEMPSQKNGDDWKKF
jgi:hypothetical protein